MVKVKLSDKYSNDFLTTHKGEVFYKKDNKLGKKCESRDVDLNNLEIANLLQQQILVIDDEAYEKHNGEDKVKTITEDKPVNTVNNKLKTEVQDKEPKPQVKNDKPEVIELEEPEVKEAIE